MRSITPLTLCTTLTEPPPIHGLSLTQTVTWKNPGANIDQLVTPQTGFEPPCTGQQFLQEQDSGDEGQFLREKQSPVKRRPMINIIVFILFKIDYIFFYHHSSINFLSYSEYLLKKYSDSCLPFQVTGWAKGYQAPGHVIDRIPLQFMPSVLQRHGSFNPRHSGQPAYRTAVILQAASV